jgi:hypothetical protein
VKKFLWRKEGIMPKRGKIDIGDLNEATTETVQNDISSASETVSTPPPKERAAESSTPTPAYESPRRRPRSKRQDAFDFGTWILEGVVGIAGELRHNDLGLSEEFWIHAYAARREALLAARSLLDVAIERCEQDRPPSATRKKPKQRGSVDINFS